MPDPKIAVRVRFAPSPTGDPHIGSMWTALFNYLFARQHGGVFVLRIEDTDQKRLVPGAQEKIIDALDWYGLTPDEGPSQGGPHAPYIQSQRLGLYREHVQKLLAAGRAYYCFCTADRLERLRAEQTAAKRAPRYDKYCLTIPVDQAGRRVESGEPAVVRLNMPTSGQVVHHDLIRGQVTFAYDQIDDSVLLKSDGFPTYHLANVVDDHLMDISHVIRAEEWLPSIPKHLYLYEAFGWTPPLFAHLPLLLGPDKSKLSKRHGATSALAFREEGYLPDAMRNFLVLMGWHPKGDEEIMDQAEILAQFKLADVHPAGAVFDRTKLDWMNGAYIRSLPLDDFLKSVRPFWHHLAGESVTSAWQTAAVELVRARMKRLDEIDELTGFGFSSVWNEQVKDFDRQLLVPKKGNAVDATAAIDWFADWAASQSEPWTATGLKSSGLAAIAAAGRKNGEVLWPVRVALTLRAASPDVFDVMQLLGQAETLRRLRALTAS
ncbi:MAG: glutamate--tRNA ligase [Candidatus Kerfeldbacteria bacterium]|nr:glutamate--tRNA ligase [Candidatus Kerfeldbacteria bacterium]